MISIRTFAQLGMKNLEGCQEFLGLRILSKLLVRINRSHGYSHLKFESIPGNFAMASH